MVGLVGLPGQYEVTIQASKGQTWATQFLPSRCAYCVWFPPDLPPYPTPLHIRTNCFQHSIEWCWLADFRTRGTTPRFSSHSSHRLGVYAQQQHGRLELWVQFPEQRILVKSAVKMDTGCDYPHSEGYGFQIVYSTLIANTEHQQNDHYDRV